MEAKKIQIKKPKEFKGRSFSTSKLPYIDTHNYFSKPKPKKNRKTKNIFTSIKDVIYEKLSQSLIFHRKKKSDQIFIKKSMDMRKSIETAKYLHTKKNSIIDEELVRIDTPTKNENNDCTKNTYLFHTLKFISQQKEIKEILDISQKITINKPFIRKMNWDDKKAIKSTNCDYKYNLPSGDQKDSFDENKIFNSINSKENLLKRDIKITELFTDQENEVMRLESDDIISKISQENNNNNIDKKDEFENKTTNNNTTDINFNKKHGWVSEDISTISKKGDFINNNNEEKNKINAGLKEPIHNIDNFVDKNSNKNSHNNNLIIFNNVPIENNKINDDGNINHGWDPIDSIKIDNSNSKNGVLISNFVENKNNIKSNNDNNKNKNTGGDSVDSMKIDNEINKNIGWDPVDSIKIDNENNKNTGWDPVDSMKIDNENNKNTGWDPVDSMKIDNENNKNTGWDPVDSMKIDNENNKNTGWDPVDSMKIDNENNKNTGWDPVDSMKIDNENNKNTGWDPVDSMKIDHENNKNTGWDPVDSMKIDNENNKNTGWDPVDSMKIDNENNKNIGWDPVDSMKIDNENNKNTGWDPVDSMKIDNENNKNTGWDPVESVDPSQFNKGWDPVESVDPSQVNKGWDAVESVDPSQINKGWDAVESVDPNEKNSQKSLESLVIYPQPLIQLIHNNSPKNNFGNSEKTGNFNKISTQKMPSKLEDNKRIKKNMKEKIIDQDEPFKTGNIVDSISLGKPNPNIEVTQNDDSHFDPPPNNNNSMMRSNVSVKSVINSPKKSKIQSVAVAEYTNIPDLLNKCFCKVDKELKEKKLFKNIISKIISDKNEMVLILKDLEKKICMKIKLFSNFNYICKNHTQGKISGRIFIYDNNGKVGVYIGTMDSIFSEDDDNGNRKITDLLIGDTRQDPTLFVFEINSDKSILFVIGGYHYIGFKNKVTALSDILVFEINVNENFLLSPIIKINMKFPRMSPLIFCYKSQEQHKNEKYLCILGGNNPDKLTKVQQKVYFNSNSIAEIINLNKIHQTIFKKAYRNIKELSTDDVLSISDSNIKKLPPLINGGVLKYRKYNQEITNFLILLKQQMITIEHIDHLNFRLYFQRGLKGINSNYLCNQMICNVNDQNIVYFSDNHSFETENISLKSIESSFWDCCNIF